MIRLDAATVLLQWAAGGLLFLWFTTHRHEVSAGYGWLLRGTYAVLAAGAAACGFALGVVPVRETASVLVAVTALATVRRRDPMVDLVAPVIGVVGMLAGALDAATGAGDTAVALTRVAVGTVFLGAVSDAMLLGHWYLVQPGMPRRILNEVVHAVRWVLPVQVVVML
ncbi:MAG: hypothetical protein ACKO1X_07945, partial [Acidimicrobiales bacterium]